MYFSSLFAARTGSAMAQGFSQTQLTRAQRALAHRVNPIGLTLALALRDDCCFFAALSAFAVMLLHGLGRCCCVASRAGWKMTAAASVVRSDSAISLPMLDVPG
jgi:hypothetical protein